jgi:protocatechuate 3,4-dioxygenase beta subunit
MRPLFTFAGPLLGLALLVAACGSSAGTDAPTASTATASTATAPPASTAAGPASSASSATACTAPATATTAQTEGPYYKAGAPASADLVTNGMAGTRVTLTGLVLGTDCTPLADAKVEIWQADAAGTYDNTGYTLRGYVMTDAQGRYTIRTIVPGEYPGRTQHIHVKVTPAGGSTLTTQLYFPGTAANDSDGIYSPDMLLAIAQDDAALIGTYTFIVAS